jgi:hypothetical protein
VTLLWQLLGYRLFRVLVVLFTLSGLRWAGGRRRRSPGPIREGGCRPALGRFIACCVCSRLSPLGSAYHHVDLAATAPGTD